MQYCSVHDCTVASSIGCNCNTVSNNNITVSNNVTFNIANAHINQAANVSALIFDGNLLIRSTDANSGIISTGGGANQISNTTVVGAVGNGISLGNANGPLQLNSSTTNLISHSNGGAGILVQGHRGTTAWSGTFTCWRNGSSGFAIAGCQGNLTIPNYIGFGSINGDIGTSNALSYGRFIFTNAICRAGVNLTSIVGVLGGSTGTGAGGLWIFESCEFGTNGQTYSTSDIGPPTSGGFYQVWCINCLFGSSATVQTQNNMCYGSYISSQKHNQTAGSHRFYTGEGTGTIDTSIYDTTPSLRMTPIASANPTLRPMESAPPGLGWQVPVANGQTVTFSVKVRKSVANDGTAYNGNLPRLYVRRNVALGINSDTLLATATAASVGAFETISGVTAAVTDDGVLEFFVDTGVGIASPTGWINVDTTLAS